MSESLNYDELQNRCVQYLNERKFISVATSDRDQVRARVVDYINDGIRIVFLTWENSVKIDHLKHNPRIALCVDSLQIEGNAEFKGHPSLRENECLMALYRERHPLPYKNFINQPGMVVVTVEPELMILMSYQKRHLRLQHLDVLKLQAWSDILSPWDPT